MVSLSFSKEQPIGFADGLDEGYEKSKGWQEDFFFFLARTAGWKVMPLTKIKSIGGRIGFWVNIRSFTFSILCF